MNLARVITRFLFFVAPLAVSIAASADVVPSKFFLGTSAFMLANLDHGTDEPPKFYQLNLGYRLTEKDVVSIEAITWRYYGPLGIPIGGNSSDKFPGYVSAEGVGIAYQRFLWDNIYASVHATLLAQDYFTPTSDRLRSGHQLFVAYRVGYHIALGSHFFLEPSVAMTTWPVNTGLPASFQEKEDLWPKHNFEPGFHIGYVY